MRKSILDEGTVALGTSMEVWKSLRRQTFVSCRRDSQLSTSFTTSVAVLRLSLLSRVRLKPGPHQQQKICRSNIVERYKLNDCFDSVECCFDKVERYFDIDDGVDVA